eukprot:gene13219-4037_t
MPNNFINDLSKEAQKKSEELRWIKVVGIGSPGVGKTCLVKTFCESKFTKSYIETVGVDYVRVTFWDFGGSSSYLDVRKELYHQTKICLLVYDVTNPQSFYALDDWFKEFETFGGKKTILCVVGNKADLKNRKVNTSTAEEWANRHEIRHYVTSAATGEGVAHMFNQVLDDAVS